MSLFIKGPREVSFGFCLDSTLSWDRLPLVCVGLRLPITSHTNTNTANHTTQHHTVSPGTVITWHPPYCTTLLGFHTALVVGSLLKHSRNASCPIKMLGPRLLYTVFYRCESDCAGDVWIKATEWWHSPKWVCHYQLSILLAVTAAAGRKSVWDVRGVK